MLRLKLLVLTGLTAFAHMALLGELARAARLSWNDHSDNETGFSIERSWDGEQWTEVGTVGPDVTEFEDVGLGAIRRLYYYRVRAFNDYGYSGYTNVAAYSHEPNGQIFQGEISGEFAATALLRLSGDGDAWMIGEFFGDSRIAFSERLRVPGDGEFAFDLQRVGKIAGRVEGSQVDLRLIPRGEDGFESEGQGSLRSISIMTDSSAELERYEFSLANWENARVEIEYDRQGAGLAYVELDGAGWAQSFSLEDGGTELRLDSVTYLSLTLDPATGSLSGKLREGNAVFALTPLGIHENPESILSNISIRSWIEGKSTAIAGFAIAGKGRKRLLVRAAGPALEALGVDQTASDLSLALWRSGSSEPLQSNRDWQDFEEGGSDVSEVGALVGAFPFGTGSRDAAFILELEEGLYWVFVSNEGEKAGTTLMEIYDLDQALGRQSTAWLANFSMRNRTGVGHDPIIAGFVVSGPKPKGLLIRAMGRELEDFQVPQALNDPMLRLYQYGIHEPIAINDDWGAWERALNFYALDVGAFDFKANSRSAAMVQWLNPGLYTAVAQGVSGDEGEVLVEVYALP